MAITHFSISLLPDENIIESKINGNPIVLDNLYVIAQQSFLSFVRTSGFDDLFVSDKFVWKCYNVPENKESNNSNCNLIWKDSSNAIPLSSNKVETILNNDILNLFNVLTFNSVTEIIKIISINGSGVLKYNDVVLYENQQYLIQDLFYVNFTPELSGGGNPYCEIQFQVGKDNIIDTQTTYSLLINIDSEVEIINFSESVQNDDEDYDVSGSTVTYNTIEQSFLIKLQNSYANSLVHLEIDITSPWLSLNSFNKIEFLNNSDFIEKTSDEVFSIYVQTDSFGFAELTMNNIIVEDTMVPKLGDVKITIIDVNGDTNLVSTINEVTLNTNL